MSENPFWYECQKLWIQCLCCLLEDRTKSAAGISMATGLYLMIDRYILLQRSIHITVPFIQHIFRIRNCGSLAKQINGLNCLKTDFFS